MMNINEGDVDLGLPKGSTNLSIQTKSSDGLGAGVNAFPASAPLSELVWSPNNGLSLKCAHSNTADKNPFLLCNVVEHCNSAVLLSRGIKREGLDRISEVNGSKKMKNKVPDNSFTNWISTMVKGPSDCNKEDLNLEKEKGSIDESREAMVDAKRSIGKQIIMYDREANPIYVGQLSKQEKCQEIVEEASESCPKVDDLDCQINAVFSVDQKLRSSEAMASVFARRLDALKNILPSPPPPSINTCYFCGGCHDLQCPNARKSDLDNVQESSCLCIGCSHCTARNMQMSVSKIVSTSNETQRAIETNNQKLAEIVDVIRSLRLSRADILRWMSLNVSLSSLNGFFVRVRLGKVESGYYVGCIGELDKVFGLKNDKF